MSTSPLPPNLKRTAEAPKVPVDESSVEEPSGAEKEALKVQEAAEATAQVASQDAAGPSQCKVRRKKVRCAYVGPDMLACRKVLNIVDRAIRCACDRSFCALHRDVASHHCTVIKKTERRKRKSLFTGNRGSMAGSCT